MSQKMVSKYFSYDELKCKHCGELPSKVLKNLKKVARKLDDIRELIGVPFIVTSGYRCPIHEAQIGGTGKNHPYGYAIDWYPERIPENIEEVLQKVKEKYKLEYPYPIRNYRDFWWFMVWLLDHIWEGGFGYYPTQGFFHTDIRYRRRWRG